MHHANDKGQGMTERVCIRGCVQRDVHWATCINNDTAELLRRAHAEENGETYVAPCKGCAPRDSVDGSLLCSPCLRRANALLESAPDILGRMRSIGDPSKSGWNWNAGDVIRTSSPHAPAPIGEDLVDAIGAVTMAYAYFGTDLTDVSNDGEAMQWVGPLVLDRHPADADGVRAAWSIQDAKDRYGVERREDHRHVFPGMKLPNAPKGSYARFDEEEPATTVTGWYDPPLTVAQAAAARGVDQRTARRWVERGRIPSLMRGRGPRGSTLTMAHASLWYAVDPCEIAHDGEWCTRITGHPGTCALREGERPTPPATENRIDHFEGARL